MYSGACIKKLSKIMRNYVLQIGCNRKKLKFHVNLFQSVPISFQEFQAVISSSLISRLFSDISTCMKLGRIFQNFQILLDYVQF